MLLSVFVVSDIHTDHAENVELLKKPFTGLESKRSIFNILIVAGDVSDNEETVFKTFTNLTKHFDAVIFVPGNHDLWITSEQTAAGLTSSDRLTHIRKRLRDELGIIVQPTRFRVLDHGQSDLSNNDRESCNILLVPLLSWHHVSFDCETEIPSSELGGKTLPSVEKVVSDFTRSKWPVMEALSQQGNAESLSAHSEMYKQLLAAFNIDTQLKDTSRWQTDVVARLVDRLNLTDPDMEVEASTPRSIRKGDLELIINDETETIQQTLKGERLAARLEGETMITISHFLPFPFLNPEKRFLFYAPLAKVIGSQYLGERLIQVEPDAHVFGHTHFGWNSTLEAMLHGQATKPSEEVRRSKLLQCRFVQAPLGYPRERGIRQKSLAVGKFNYPDQITTWVMPLLQLSESGDRIWNDDKAYWSHYYQTNARDGENTRVADYVRKIYERA